MIDIGFDIAHKLHKLGFDEYCADDFVVDVKTGDISRMEHYHGLQSNYPYETICPAPTYEQVVDWFETKKLYLSRYWYNDRYNKPRWAYSLTIDNGIDKYIGSNLEEVLLKVIDIYEKRRNKPTETKIDYNKIRKHST